MNRLVELQERFEESTPGLRYSQLAGKTEKAGQQDFVGRSLLRHKSSQMRSGWQERK
jgi:hypothetical protein